MTRYALILFESTHEAIHTDKILREHLPVTLIPTPRRFSVSCGIALRFEVKQINLITKLIQEYSINGTVQMMDE